MKQINRLINAHGILGASVGGREQQNFGFSAEVSETDRARWKALIGRMAEAIDASPIKDDEIRVVLAGETVVLRRNDGVYVGIVVVKGHPVVKSMKRMIRSTLKQMGAPIRREEMARPPAAAPPAPTPAAAPAPPRAPGDDGNSDGFGHGF